MEKTLITPYFFILLLFLISQHVRAQVQPSASPGLEPSTDSISSRPKEVIIVAVLSIFLFVAFYFIYLCCCIDEHLIGIRNWSGWRRPWDAFSGSHRQHSSKTAPSELDPNVVQSFPKFEYGTVKSLMSDKGNLECAVCLTEYNDKDLLRLIPICDHVFHAHCVDDWLVSHATCPVCRLNLTNTDLWVHNNDVGLGDDIERNMRMTRNLSPSLSSGRPRWWLGRLSRSLSTGHVSEDMDRYTLPREARKKIMCEGRSKSTGWAYSLGKKYKFDEEDVSRTSLEEESSVGVVPVDPTQLPV